MAKSPMDNPPHTGEAKSNPQPPRPTRRFRWSLVLVPGICLLAVWISNHVQPAITWQEILDRFHVQDQDREGMSRLVALGLTCIGAVVIKRIWVAD